MCPVPSCMRTGDACLSEIEIWNLKEMNAKLKIEILLSDAYENLVVNQDFTHTLWLFLPPVRKTIFTLSNNKE